MSGLSPPTLQDGSAMPPLIFGTRINAHRHTQPDILQALQSEFRAIETAPTRKFHNEDQDGDAIRTAFLEHITKRESLFVQTKYTSPYGHAIDQTTWPYNIEDSHSLQVLKSLAQSIKDLQVNCFDAYFLHSPLESIVDTLEIWRTMEDIAHRGGVRYLGLSNVNAATLGHVWNQAIIKPVFM